MVAIKILETISDNLEEIEEEYLVLRDLSEHPNLPSFIGMFLRKGISSEDDQLWFVMEVSSLACKFSNLCSFKTIYIFDDDHEIRSGFDYI